MAADFSTLLKLTEMRKNLKDSLFIAGLPVTPKARSARPIPMHQALAPGSNKRTSGQWLSLGPSKIGGRTRSVIIARTGSNSTVIWLGSAGGGIWSSTDGGKNFNSSDDKMANLSISCMALDPTNTSVLYAGTGEGFSSNDAPRGAGIFQTSSGGKWQQIQATNKAEFSFVTRIAVSADGKVLLASVRGAPDDTTGVTPPPGIFRSEDSAHGKWTRVLATDIADVKFHPSDRSRAVAGSLKSGQSYYSSDGGKTWRISAHADSWGAGGAARVEVAFAAKKGSPVVYASVDTNQGELWRSNDLGETYVKEVTNTADGNNARFLGTQGWYDNAVWAGDPDNDDFVVLGGVYLWKRETRNGWIVKISDDTRVSAHSDIHAITADPRYKDNNKVVFAGTDGGLFSADIATLNLDSTSLPWVNLNNGYCVTQFYHLTTNAATGTIVAGTQDNGTLTYSSSGSVADWAVADTGDGGWCASDPLDSKCYYAEYVNLAIERSDDGGATFNDQSGYSNYIHGLKYDPQLGGNKWRKEPHLVPDAQINNGTLFIAPFTLDPRSPQRILAGGRSLWETDDAKTSNPEGPSWFELKDPIFDYYGDACNISAIALHNDGNASVSNIVWVGYTDGHIYNTADSFLKGGCHWTLVGRDSDADHNLPERYCTSIAPDPADSKICYATFGGYSTGNIWKTMDFGAHWNSIGQGLPKTPINSVTIHPNKSSYVYIGTNAGIFASQDGGDHWAPTNPSAAACAVDDLAWLGTTLIAATYGRGIFVIDVPVEKNP